MATPDKKPGVTQSIMGVIGSQAALPKNDQIVVTPLLQQILNLLGLPAPPSPSPGGNARFGAAPNQQAGRGANAPAGIAFLTSNNLDGVGNGNGSSTVVLPLTIPAGKRLVIVQYSISQDTKSLAQVDLNEFSDPLIGGTEFYGPSYVAGTVGTTNYPIANSFVSDVNDTPDDKTIYLIVRMKTAGVNFSVEALSFVTDPVPVVPNPNVVQVSPGLLTAQGASNLLELDIPIPLGKRVVITSLNVSFNGLPTKPQIGVIDTNAAPQPATYVMFQDLFVQQGFQTVGTYLIPTSTPGQTPYLNQLQIILTSSSPLVLATIMVTYVVIDASPIPPSVIPLVSLGLNAIGTAINAIPNFRSPNVFTTSFTTGGSGLSFPNTDLIAAGQQLFVLGAIITFDSDPGANTSFQIQNKKGDVLDVKNVPNATLSWSIQYDPPLVIGDAVNNEAAISILTIQNINVGTTITLFTSLVTP